VNSRKAGSNEKDESKQRGYEEPVDSTMETVWRTMEFSLGEYRDWCKIRYEWLQLGTCVMLNSSLSSETRTKTKSCLHEMLTIL